MTDPVIAAAWFDDPHGGDQLRWWDGSQWTDHVAPRPVPAPAVHPVSVAPEPTPSVVEEQQEPAQNRKPIAIVGAVVLLGVLLFGVPLLRGDDPAVSGPAPAANTNSVAGPAAAPEGAPPVDAANIPAGPLAPQEYATRMRELMTLAESKWDDLPSDPTSEDLRAAAQPAREAVAAMQALAPPQAVSVEHARFVSLFDASVRAFEAWADAPDDMNAGLAVYDGMDELEATTATIEQKLGVDIDGAPPAAAA